MTKHDRNWTFALIALAITFIVGPCFWAKADSEKSNTPTCEQNAIHIATTRSELKGIAERFKASDNDDVKLILGTEGEVMEKLLKMLMKWRETHNCDV